MEKLDIAVSSHHCWGCWDLASPPILADVVNSFVPVLDKEMKTDQSNVLLI